MLLPFGQIAEIICLFFAFRFLSGRKDAYWGSFKWFMLLTVFVEVWGYIDVITNNDKPNHWLYNLYLPVEMGFKFYLLYQICRPYFAVQYLIRSFVLLFCVLYGYESINSGFREYSIWSNAFASVGILVTSCCYYYYFLKKEEYVDIYQHGPFWIITGLFFFYLGGSACNLFFKYLAGIYLKTQIPVRYIIFTLLSIILYGCWVYAFLCKYRKTISSS